MRHFKKIYSDYRHQVYFFVRKYISGPEDIEDVVQEIFIHLWKYDAQLQKSGHPESVIFRTAKQEIANFYRKNKMIFASDPEIIAGLEETQEEADIFWKEENLIKIERLLHELPARNKDLLLRNKLENVSYVKLAEENNLSKTAVEKRINKALAYIRSNLSLF
ncbi:RNA polymerase sigma factor [Chryseobacterium hagamense]|uniref:DNA-directed RNA polymerase sigma-70 factor n=1 Tax=Chryseobacterium hagamense TaxID=395935 RepID=A0A511YPD0_9FLAO|nr:sigma-70 family RNA polymerase sigma factor [Chryseobacterium hagamense]GEN77051.1 DNA-directed RNA polymerase sigma-70 factor [Chryseobacterium hagamense]